MASTHRLNMEIDLQSKFGLHVTWCVQLYSLAETPAATPLSPRIWTRITRALLVSKDRRHLFVPPAPTVLFQYISDVSYLSSSLCSCYVYLHSDGSRVRGSFLLTNNRLPVSIVEKYREEWDLIEGATLGQAPVQETEVKYSTAA